MGEPLLLMSPFVRFPAPSYAMALNCESTVPAQALFVSPVEIGPEWKLVEVRGKTLLLSSAGGSGSRPWCRPSARNRQGGPSDR